MSEPLAHVYDLALRALEEQERQVVELRSRLAAALATGGAIATLLLRSALRGRGADPLHVLLVATGVAGIAVTAVAATYLLASRRLRFAIDAGLASDVMRRCGMSDVEAFYLSMIPVLDEHRLENARVIRRFDAAFTVMVCGMLVAVCGLVAALAVA